MDAVDDPLQHAEVFAVAGPEELAVFVAAEPIDVEDPRRILQAAAEVEPMAEVVAHVVAAERQHGERIAADLAELAEGGGGHFGTHRGGRVNAEGPVESLRHQRHRGAAATAEDEGFDRHTLRIVVGRIGRRALRHRRGEAAIGVGGFRFAAGRPIVALPVDGVLRADRRPCLPTRCRHRR